MPGEQGVFGIPALFLSPKTWRRETFWALSRVTNRIKMLNWLSCHKMAFENELGTAE